jgi:hypothetical protein
MHVALDRPGRLHLNTLGGGHIADDRAGDHSRPRGDVAPHFGAAPEHELMLGHVDCALHVPVDTEVLRAGDPPVYRDPLSDPGVRASFRGSL